MTPLVLLDIDGCCSPLCNRSGLRSDWDWSFTHCGWNRGWTAPQLASQLMDLAQHAEIVWCTGWEEEAAMYGRALGVPGWPSLRFGSSGGEMFKLPAVRAMAGTRPVLWFDDEHDLSTAQWASARTADGVPTRAYRVDPMRGLTDNDFAAATAWLTSLPDCPATSWI